MAEKMTPNGLVVGLIIEPEAVEILAENEPEVAPVAEKPKRTRQPKGDE